MAIIRLLLFFFPLVALWLVALFLVLLFTKLLQLFPEGRSFLNKVKERVLKNLSEP